jgi:anti-sigma B factor antagonist
VARLADEPSPGGLVLSSRTEGEAIVLLLAGELDLASAELVRSAPAQITGPLARRVVIDLSGLSFIDCAGMRAVLDLYRRLRASSRCSVELRPGPHAVQRVFEFAGLERELPFT